MLTIAQQQFIAMVLPHGATLDDLVDRTCASEADVSHYLSENFGYERGTREFPEITGKELIAYLQLLNL